MRGTLNSFTAGGRQVFVYAPPGAERPLPLVQMAAGEELAAQLPQVMGEVEPLLGRGCAPFLLAWTAPVDWERDYTPWPAPALPGRPPFAGGADAYLDLLAGTVRPAVAARFDILSGPGDTALAGYSLGGLLALYGLLSRPEYGRAASLSGSLWYDGWAAWQAEHPARPGCRCYLSLGKAEERSRDARMSRVGRATRAASELLQGQLGPQNAVLEWNNGGHFTGVPHRIAKGLLWLMRG